MEFSLEIRPMIKVVPEGRKYLYNLYKDHIRALEKVANDSKPNDRSLSNFAIQPGIAEST